MRKSTEGQLKIEAAVARAYLGFTICIFLIGAGLSGYQCILWLRDGYWTALPMRLFIPQSATVNWDSARGIEKLWNWFLDSSTSTVVISIGALMFFGASGIVSEADRTLAAHRKQQSLK